jgi:hypothetical protein
VRPKAPPEPVRPQARAEPPRQQVPAEPPRQQARAEPPRQAPRAEPPRAEHPREQRVERADEPRKGGQNERQRDKGRGREEG